MVLCSLVYGSDRNSGGIENMKINNSQKFWSLMTARILAGTFTYAYEPYISYAYWIELKLAIVYF